MRNLKYLPVLLAAGLLFSGAGQATAGLVYLGQDSSYHYPGHPEGAVMGGNAAVFASGGVANPTIAVIDGGGFGANVIGMLNSRGLTNLTSVAPGSLASTNLSNYQVLYFAPTTSSGAVADYIAAAAQIQAYVSGGGGLVVEPEVFATGSWSWVPYAALIGHSGSTNGQADFETVNIVAPGHPVMAGLTNAGLSNWSLSVHSDFSTPGLAGFTTLTTDSLGHGVDIALGPTTTTPEPGSLTLLGLGLASFGGLGWMKKRRTKVVAA